MAKKSAPQPEDKPIVEIPEALPKNCIPPIPFERNEYGLYKHIDYIFDADGNVDWRKMIKLEHLFPNKDKTSETDVSKLDDTKLLISLAGIKHLAQLRGYDSVKHYPVISSPDFVGVETSIVYIGNYETQGRPVSFSAMADAHPGNTKNFTRNYLSTIAENRGFVRAVRNFLKIHIVGQDEIGNNGDVETAPDTQTNQMVEAVRTKLDEILKAENIKFSALQNVLIRDGFPAESWKSTLDIPIDQLLPVKEHVQEGIRKKKESAAK